MERFLEINSGRRRPARFASAKTIDDLRGIARAKLPNFVFEMLEGGADDEATLRRNRSIFARFLLSPKALVAIDPRDLGIDLLGVPAKLPIIVAPTGGNAMYWTRGDLAMAEAAADAGIPFAQSTVSMMPIEDVAKVKGLRHWFQLYEFGGPRTSHRLMERALAANCEALVVTIDGAITGNREWDRRNYAKPGVLSLRSNLNVALHPGWIWRTLVAGGVPNFVNLLEFVDVKNPTMFDVSRWTPTHDPRLTWTSIAEIRKQWPRPLILKGILRTDDVRRAIDAGVDGVVLSNHGGRQAEPTISPLEILASTRRAVGPDYPLIVDSGFRRGAEVAIAMALGASAVMLGRSLLYGLAAKGKPGAAAAIEIFRSELDRTLALIGVPAVRKLSSDALSALPA